MAVRDARSDVKQTTAGFRGPLMVQSLTSAKSKFLSLALLESKFLFPGLGAANWLRLPLPHLQRSSGINKAGLA